MPVKWFNPLKPGWKRKERAEAPAPAPEDSAPLQRSPLAPATDLERLGTLSPREREVFDGLMEGKRQREIADQLNVKLTTVSFHCTSLYRKLDIHDKAHLFLRYARYRPDPPSGADKD